MRTTTITIAALLFFSGAANADCIGSGSLKTCYDDSGNTYTVQKFGNSTYVNGSNSRTGSRWNQDSQRIGNSTYTNGRDADGNSWNSTATKMGNTTIINGRDSTGKTFSTICDKNGCY
ncbi:hypothetical protein ACSZMF_14220 [Aeromonas caviae]|uniref:hypothetical protein n=1 Tax=Aeromonas caviae TaxID=648 RepID=UPI003A1B2E14